MRYIILLLFLFSTLFSFDESSGHFIEALPKKNRGEKLYLEQCASCHHKDRIGLDGPPLFDKTLKKYRTLSKLSSKIKDGFPQTLMPTFTHLSDVELIDIARYIKRPLDKNIQWTKKDIKNSIKIFKNPKKDIGISDIDDITPVVERDGGYVWIMEKEKVLDKFPLKNVHGGIKYQFPKAENIFVPTRDGIVAKYSLKNGRVEGEFRACINLRNVSLSRDGRYGFATCLLPEQLVVFDTDNFNVEKVIKLDGKVSALYEFYTKDEAIFTYRNKPQIGFLDTKTLKLTFKDIDEPIEDFFIDPFDRYLIATARRGKVLRVYEIDSLKEVYEHHMKGMPHLFSATYFYKDGDFYFATPHLRSNFITIWKMYDWDFVKKIDIGGDGFFVKTHPRTPYLWIDNGSDKLILVSKDDYSTKTLTPVKGKRYIHTEFSGDGKYTYLSIYEHDGLIEVLNTDTLEKIVSYPANIPVGKYNFICKNRRFYPKLFGEEIFKEKCWGCHHEKAEAFGPSFAKIADTRSESQMIAHILAPETYAKDLGYKRNLMPPFKLNNFELKSIVDYIKSCKTK
jgi:mono/diheme cytochrome c family protein